MAATSQVCYVCHYGTNLPSECVNDPKSWQGGEARVNCPYDCTINAIFNAESGTPTYVYRGCHDSTRDDGCVVVGDTHNCFFSCKDRDYCNGQAMTRSPLLDSDGASTLTPLSSGGLLVSVGSFCTIVLMRLTLTKLYG
ncbi:hypothetical protein PoB_005454400 [Plakobranchus ocellatus]|uniref:Protein quiver n=1 Tax=Plakobranchus ocellatus TaxID=259542 RepID=A0AAV4C665_9GAST|nr:hypothetical protein PoB_005454400 [Plakobranchus ocellatus]